jgi:hypothetical protein
MTLEKGRREYNDARVYHPFMYIEAEQFASLTAASKNRTRLVLKH